MTETVCEEIESQIENKTEYNNQGKHCCMLHVLTLNVVNAEKGHLLNTSFTL